MCNTNLKEPNKMAHKVTKQDFSKGVVKTGFFITSKKQYPL